MLRPSKTILAILLTFTVPTQNAFGSDPIDISNVEQLLGILNDSSNSTYRLVSSLDLEIDDVNTTDDTIQTANDLTSSQTSYLGYFSGTFDGNGKTISGLNKPLFEFLGTLDPTNPIEVRDLTLQTVVDGINARGILVSDIGSNVTIDNVSVEGKVIGGNYDVGGIAGTVYALDSYNSSSIINSTSSVDVSGIDNVGGLVGITNEYVLINNSRSTGEVIGNFNIGGAVGVNGGLTLDLDANSSVTGSSNVGGAVGVNNGTLSGSTSSGAASGFVNVGGLIGANHAYVENSTSSVTVNGDLNVGGLVGINYVNVFNSAYEGSVQGNSNVGGLVGTSNGKISRGYSSGEVSGNYLVGGLVGEYQAIYWDSLISNSYSSSTVNGLTSVGGLIGRSRGDISNTYATGEVWGQDYVGGLFGSDEWGYLIQNSYATGNVYSYSNTSSALSGWSQYPEFTISSIGYGQVVKNLGLENEELLVELEGAPNVLSIINESFTDGDSIFEVDSCINLGNPFLDIHRAFHQDSCLPDTSDGNVDRVRISSLERESRVLVKFLTEILSSKGFLASIFNTSDAGFSFLSSVTSDIDRVHLVAISENANEELSFKKDDVVQLQVNGEKGSQATLWTTNTNGDEIFLGTITYTEAGTAVLPAMKFSTTGTFALSLRPADKAPALKSDSASDLATIKFVIS